MPARDGDVRLVAVAARNRDRAVQFAAENGVDRVVDSYEELLADPEVEVVYNALPNSMHGPWNLAAIQAGKHVLSEKPFASNADEAREVAAAAADSGLIVFDAFHYRYHPIFHRFLAAITDGEIGNEQQLFDTITAMRGRSRIFMVGIGSAPNSYLMTRAAELGRGDPR